MNTARIYHDSEGNECTIFQAVRREPSWAASRIQEGEKAIEKAQELEIIRQKLQLNCKVLRSKVKQLEKENEDLENKILFKNKGL